MPLKWNDGKISPCLHRRQGALIISSMLHYVRITKTLLPMLYEPRTLSLSPTLHEHLGLKLYNGWSSSWWVKLMLRGRTLSKCHTKLDYSFFLGPLFWECPPKLGFYLCLMTCQSFPSVFEMHLWIQLVRPFYVFQQDLMFLGSLWHLWKSMPFFFCIMNRILAIKCEKTLWLVITTGKAIE